jgi:hypothetical protein
MHPTDGFADASIGVRDLPLTVAGRALDGIDSAAWLQRLLHGLVACSIAGRADVLFDLRPSHAARTPFAVSQKPSGFAPGRWPIPETASP